MDSPVLKPMNTETKEELSAQEVEMENEEIESDIFTPEKEEISNADNKEK